MTEQEIIINDLTNLTKRKNAYLYTYFKTDNKRYLHKANLIELIIYDLRIMAGIIPTVCDAYQVTEKDILSGHRKAHIIDATMIIMSKKLVFDKKKLQHIATDLNRISHATVLHGINKVIDSFGMNDQRSRKIEKICRDYQQNGVSLYDKLVKYRTEKDKLKC